MDFHSSASAFCLFQKYQEQHFSTYRQILPQFTVINPCKKSTCVCRAITCWVWPRFHLTDCKVLTNLHRKNWAARPYHVGVRCLVIAGSTSLPESHLSSFYLRTELMWGKVTLPAMRGGIFCPVVKKACHPFLSRFINCRIYLRDNHSDHQLFLLSQLV